MGIDAHELGEERRAIAYREKDIEYARVAIGHGLADLDTLRRRPAETDVDDQRRARADTLFATAFGSQS